MTGQAVVEYALKKGMCKYRIYGERLNEKEPLPIPMETLNILCYFLGKTVRLLYRTEATVPETFKNNVELVQGDVTIIDDVKRTIEGVDAVIVTLGTRNKLEPTKVLSSGLQNIIDAMKLQPNLAKISVCLSSFLFWEPEKVPAQFGNLNAEHKAMLDIIKSSGLDFIAVLPPHISNEPSSEHQILHDKSPGRIIAKTDLANFFVDSLEMPEHYGKVCGIAKTGASQ